VFEAGYSALEDACGHQRNREASTALAQPRLRVVSAPVGAGKTSFALQALWALDRTDDLRSLTGKLALRA
jgi:hypothetical protein